MTADMGERPSGTDELTVRYKVWQTSTVVSAGIVTSLCAVAAVAEPRAYLPLLLAPVLLVCMFWLASRAMRLQVTQTMVRARAGRWHGRPDVETPRIEICEIHYCPARISFLGTHGQPLMEPYPLWTLNQVRQVADLLDVPLYDHRGWLHLRELAVGRLVNRDPSGSACRF